MTTSDLERARPEFPDKVSLASCSAELPRPWLQPRVGRRPSGILALVLAGGRGTRLGALTHRCAKPAVPFGAGLRIIDFSLANCVNSQVGHVGVITQHLAETLTPYIEDRWAARGGRQGCAIEVLPHTRCEIPHYSGTANAVYRNLDFIREQAPAQVLVLGGDHIYRMDYRHMLARHVERGARVTVACVEVPVDEATAFGVMDVDGSGRIRGFEEKPRTPRPMPGRPGVALASMGIYLFDTAYLIDTLIHDAQKVESTHDFGADVIPRAVEHGEAWAFEHVDLADPARCGYWRDVGSLDAYWRSNLDLLDRSSGLDAFDQAWPIRGPGSPSLGATVAASAWARHSVLGSATRIGEGSLVEDSVLLAGASIGPACRLRKAIVAEGCQLPAGTVIGESLVADRSRFEVSAGGVVLITPEMLRQPALAA